MKMNTKQIILRLTLVMIMIMHSVPAMFNNGVNDFGRLYLNTVGFAPFGLALAWLIKLSHIGTAITLIFNRWIVISGTITIFILFVGILTVHWTNGWFVVGAGRNGIEYNVLLIACFANLIIENKNK